MDVIHEAQAKDQAALTEYAAKRFLAESGIPVCREELARDADAAAACAMELGFPVVVKASGVTLLHKTEVGGVALNLRSEQEVRRESQRLLEIPGCEEVLVQEMVRGEREFVCGLLRDRDLGPCVMFGLGGIFTEALDDAVFRIAPLSAWDAAEMLAEIRSAKLLEPFRGEPAVAREALSRILIALGEIGLRHEAIQAIDLNPVKIRRDGVPVAVDALISLKSGAGVRR